MKTQSRLLTIDQPSRIYFNYKDELYLSHLPLNKELHKPQIIVLTNDAEIKEGDLYYSQWITPDNNNYYSKIMKAGEDKDFYKAKIKTSMNKKIIASSFNELTHGIDDSLIQDIIKYYNEHKEMPEIELEECKEGKYKGDFMVVLSTNEVIGKVAWRNSESINETYEGLGIDTSDEPSVKAGSNFVRGNLDSRDNEPDVQQILLNVSQLIAGWKATTPQNEWSEYDEECRIGLCKIQTLVENGIYFKKDVIGIIIDFFLDMRNNKVEYTRVEVNDWIEENLK